MNLEVDPVRGSARPLSRVALAVSAVLIYAACPGVNSSGPQIGTTVELLTNAATDPSSRVSDAVVSLGFQGAHDCTGVLVAPTLVLTAGHCLGNGMVDGGSGEWSSQGPIWRAYGQRSRPDPDWVSWIRGDRDGVREQTFLDGPLYDRRILVDRAACAAACNADGERCQAWMFLGAEGRCALMPMPKIVVNFGNTHASPTHTVVSSTYSTPGRADIVMLKLDDSVPATVAEPSPVLSYLPDTAAGIATFLRAQRFFAVGFSTAHPERQRATMRFNEYPYQDGFDAGGDLAMVAVVGEAGATTEGGDSGSPLFVTRTSAGVERRFVVGILQGYSGDRNRYTLTGLNLRSRGRLLAMPYNNATVDRTQAAPIGEWLNNVMYADFIAVNPRRPLFSWFSASRGDNFLSSDPHWASDPRTAIADGSGNYLDPDRFQDGYFMYRQEGYVFDPHASPPTGTVPLWSWFSEARGDNFTTSDPRWSVPKTQVHWSGDYLTHQVTRDGYRLFRIEGYVYDPHRPQPPNTRPLYSWFSAARGDNFQTTDPHWAIPSSQVRWSGENIASVDREGYTLYRLEGYVPISPR